MDYFIDHFGATFPGRSGWLLVQMRFFCGKFRRLSTNSVMLTKRLHFYMTKNAPARRE